MIKKYGDLETVAAIYHEGETKRTLENLKLNNGVLNQSLLTKEGRQYVPKVDISAKALGSSLSEMEQGYKKSSQALKKFETEQENAAKKIADNDRQLTESTAFGKYNTTIDELTEAHKRFIDTQGKSGISQATYSQGIENANEALLKNTDYAQENIKLLDQQAKEYAKLVGHIDDYNATIDELTRNKNRGAITQGEYGLGVAQANAGLMNQVADKQIPIERAGEVVDAKNAIEAEKSLNSQLEKSKSILDGIKTSGAGAFDGLLGGISAVTAAFTSMGETLSDISRKQDTNLATYSATLNTAGLTQEQITQSTADFYKTKDALDERSRAAEMSGIRQIAGASSKMFAEQSAGRKIMHTLEMTFGAIEMAMSAKKIVMNGIEAITNQGTGDPYTAFGRMAAMAALVSALGVGIAASVSSDGNKTSYSGDYADMSPTKSTGTVLGDNAANSKSISNITSTLNDIHAKEYPELKGINDSMKEFGKTIVNFVTGVAKATNSFTDMTFGVTQLEQPKNTLANMPFIGSLFTKTTVEKIGEGMIISAFNPLEEGMKLGLQSYSTFKITKKGLFGSSTKIQEIYGDVPSAIELELTNLFGYMGKTVMNSLVAMDLVKLLGVSLPNFQIGTQKWDWFKSDNKQDYFNNMINATADRVATVSQFIIGDFQKLGEGLYETLSRMAIQQGVVINKYHKMGLEFDSLVTKTDDGATIGSLGMAALSDSLVNMYNSTADAKDGLKNFISAMDSLYNLTTSKGAQSQNAIKGIASYFKDEAFDQTKMFDKSYIQAQLDVKKAEIKTAQEEAAKKYQDVAKFGDYVGNAFTPKSITDLETTLDPIFKKIINKGNYSGATWSDLTGGWTKEMIVSHAGQNNQWDEIIRVLDENTKNQAAGLASLNGAYSSKAEFDAAKKNAQDALDAANEKVMDLTNAISVFDEQLNKTIPKVTGLQSTYLDLTETNTQSTARKHQEIIDAEFKGMTENLAKQDVFKPVIDAMIVADKTGIKYTKTLEDGAKETVILASDIQQFVWQTEDAAKKLKSLKEAGSYLTDFSKSISHWVQNLKATSVGTPETQLAAAERAYLGDYACEFKESVHINKHPKVAGYINVAWKKQVITMKPVLSSTGALRLEDVTGRTLMIQIANKSMLLDTKIGQRLLDDCVHPEQTKLMEAAKAARIADPEAEAAAQARNGLGITPTGSK